LKGGGDSALCADEEGISSTLTDEGVASAKPTELGRWEREVAIADGNSMDVGAPSRRADNGWKFSFSAILGRRWELAKALVCGEAKVLLVLLGARTGDLAGLWFPVSAWAIYNHRRVKAPYLWPSRALKSFSRLVMRA
jgi:hypothetical protein